MSHEGVEKMRNIGVYLGTEPYGGGAFQYDQSILNALQSLPQDTYRIHAFYVNDLWEDYLRPFPFLRKKVYTRRQLFDIPGALFWKMPLCDWSIWEKIGRFLIGMSSFARQIDDEHLDLMIFPAQEGYAAGIQTKSISVIHDLMHRYEKFPEAASPLEVKRREHVYRSICKSSAMIFVDSAVGRDQVVECYGKQYANKLRIMPFAPPQYLFEQAEDVLPADVILPPKFIFYPAQFWEHKNHRNLVKAVKLLQNRGIDVQLVFVGSKKNGYERTMELIRENHLEANIHVLGYVSDSLMRILYRSARAMIMPSFFGPTNIPPLEGMAMGCPVAVSRVYAMPWQVGEAGLTFAPDDVEEMAETIRKLWQDDNLCKELSAKGKERAQYFSQEKFNGRFVKAIEEVLEN